jgi:CRISPR-associated endoribonuclease Cas6
MRFRVDVAASVAEMAWRDVHGAARAVVYGLIGDADPSLAEELHRTGWRGSGLRPVGLSRPVFAGAPREQGKYMLSAHGSIWLGSPVPDIAAALVRGLTRRGELRWGGVGLTVRGVQVEGVPDYRSGEAEFTAATPVLVKQESRFLLPSDGGCYLNRLTHNLRHKADLLGLPGEVEAEVLHSGPRRRFDVSGGFRVGAEVRLRVCGAPALLDAVHDWGVGLENIQGFGWLR